MGNGPHPALIQPYAFNSKSRFPISTFSDQPEFHPDVTIAIFVSELLASLRIAVSCKLGNFLLRRSLHSREFYFQEALTSDGMAML